MLREVWLNIGIEKIDTHEGVIVKVLLDSGATGMFMDKRTQQNKTWVYTAETRETHNGQKCG